MNHNLPFKWRHFEADIILSAVRWHLRYALSYSDVEELLRERGVAVDHTQNRVIKQLFRLAA
jgi:IS6 family transposase